jgi:hypothetical protein
MCRLGADSDEIRSFLEIVLNNIEPPERMCDLDNQALAVIIQRKMH